MEQDRNNKDSIFRSLAVIEENIQRKLTVESLAESIHLSRYHYQRVFREIMGDSVMRYVTRRRIALAAADLTETDESILTIALKYGYDSHEGFTRSFRAQMGVSPKEYRKYHLSVHSSKRKKERTTMTDSKTIDEIIRSLNNLIVQIRETAAYTRKNKAAAPDTSVFYSEFWDTVAAGADAMADELGAVLERITDLSQRPDEISARLLIMRTMETTALKSNILAFQIRLTLARAEPEHRTFFEPISDQYAGLAHNAHIKLNKVAALFRELTTLIFQDMRKNAMQKLQDAAAAGRLAAERLSEDTSLPYGYLADEISQIANGLSSPALEDISVSSLEDALFRLEIIASTADLDLLRMPSHRQLFDGIPVFRERLEETMLFFRELSEHIVPDIAKHEGLPTEQKEKKKCSELAFQSSILLFHLRGEIQKLGHRLSPEQKAAFDKICTKMNAVSQPSLRGTADLSPEKSSGILRRAYEELSAEAEKLGACGTPVRFIAEEILHLAKDAVSDNKTSCDDQSIYVPDIRI